MTHQPRRGSFVQFFGGMVRLVVGAAAALLGLLAIIPAPNNLLWMAAIVGTEAPHLTVPVALATLLPGWRNTRLGQLGVLLALLATPLLLSPTVRALPIAARLPAELDRAFGPATPRSREGAPALASPFNPLTIITGFRSPGVTMVTETFGRPADRDLLVDIFRPTERPEPLPLVVVVHGGSWSSGDRTQLAPLNTYLAARGYAVASVSYRLSTEAIYPAAADDVTAAVRYLLANAERLGIDAERVVLLGRSAGGHLALQVGYSLTDVAVRGVISFYAPADLRYGYENPANPAVLDSTGVLSAFLGGAPDTAGALYDSGSPIRLVNEDTPPTLLIHGTRDELVSIRQSERLAERLAAAGRPYLLLEPPWATHAFDASFTGPTSQLSIYAIEHFLAAVME